MYYIVCRETRVILTYRDGGCIVYAVKDVADSHAAYATNCDPAGDVYEAAFIGEPEVSDYGRELAPWLTSD